MNIKLFCGTVWIVIAAVATIIIHIKGVALSNRVLGSYSRSISQGGVYSRSISKGGVPSALRLCSLMDNSYSTCDSAVDDAYMQRFGNVAKLYPAFRRGSSESAHRPTGEDRSDGSDILHRLLNTHVCVVGLGGVGSWVVEALARSGIGHPVLVFLSALTMHRLISVDMLCCREDDPGRHG